jgi:hypothetical protein
MMSTACTHPVRKLQTLQYGNVVCKRCKAVMFPGRVFDYRHGPRTSFSAGDRVHVSSGPHGGSFKGVWLYAEDYPSGWAYCIAEKQLYQEGGEKGKPGRWVEVTASIRTIRPEHVRHDDGVRNRRKREEL